ncbi:MAG TPA: class II aldolase/adducin family protein [Solirubrobacteraceae bacterium]|nr:class II aldolase/adducin family protein [Solirubrobacteraceae bacterium]
MSDLGSLRDELAGACRRLAAGGMVTGTSGNLSARTGERVVITPTGARFEEVEGEDLAVVDLDGNQLEGRLAPTSELALHLDVYRRYDAGAVAHTHAPMATAVGCVLDELPCVHYTMLALGGSVRVAPYRTFGTPELAQAVAAALEGRTAALLANHGTIAYGGDVAGAIEATELLEWASALYLRAAALGAPRALSEEQQQATVAAALARGYGNTKPATP